MKIICIALFLVSVALAQQTPSTNNMKCGSCTNGGTRDTSMTNWCRCACSGSYYGRLCGDGAANKSAILVVFDNSTAAAHAELFSTDYKKRLIFNGLGIPAHAETALSVRMRLTFKEPADKSELFVLFNVQNYLDPISIVDKFMTDCNSASKPTYATNARLLRCDWHVVEDAPASAFASAQTIGPAPVQAVDVFIPAIIIIFLFPFIEAGLSKLCENWKPFKEDDEEDEENEPTKAPAPNQYKYGSKDV